MTTTVRATISRRVRSTSSVPPARTASEPKPSGAALALAQAYWFLDLLDDAVAKNQAELARLCGLSRMRVSQSMAMLELPQATQALLLDEAWTSTRSARAAARVGAGDGAKAVTGRRK